MAGKKNVERISTINTSGLLLLTRFFTQSDLFFCLRWRRLLATTVIISVGAANCSRSLQPSWFDFTILTALSLLLTGVCDALEKT